MVKIQVGLSLIEGDSDVKLVNGGIVFLVDMGLVKTAQENNPNFLEDLANALTGLLDVAIEEKTIEE